jgi:hypothetical protein
VQCSAAGARESTCMTFVPAIGTSCFSRCCRDVAEANDATDITRHLLNNVIEVAALAENSFRRGVIIIASASPVKPLESADEVCIG